MSNEENANKTIETAKGVVGNLVSSVMNLKEKNPKVFFGAIGGVVLLLIIMMMSGDDSKPAVSKYSSKNLAVGQRYVLKNPNALDEGATIRLVSTPGAIAAYDDTEEADRSGSLPAYARRNPCIRSGFPGCLWKAKTLMLKSESKTANVKVMKLGL